MLVCLEFFSRYLGRADFNSFVTHSTRSWYDPDIMLNKKVARISPTLGYEWLPNINYKWLKTNSLGMYDKERSKRKPDGVYRIICIGDSTTANSDYVKIIEEQLNKGRVFPSRRFEVWNCGVTGYNLIQYCRAINEKWLGFDPDLVVIGFCLNDFSATPIVFREGNTLVGYFPQRELLPFINPFLFKNFALYRICVKTFLLLGKYQRKDIYQDCYDHLVNTKNLLRSRNVRFLVVILGLVKKKESCSAVWLSDYNKIKDACRKLGVDYIDIMPLFQSNNPEQFSLFDELHFNYSGSKVVAEAIYAYLKEKKIAE